MKNKLLRNSLSILLIVTGIITVLIEIFVIYIIAWAIINGLYPSPIYEPVILIILFSVVLIFLIPSIKTLIINIGCEPNDRPDKEEQMGRTEDSSGSMQSVYT